MNWKDVRLLLLLALIAVTNLAPEGDFGGFLTGLDPQCDCEAEKAVKVTLTPAKLGLTQGENGTAQAQFLQGSTPKSASWGMRKPKASLFKASSLSAATGATTQVSVTAADSVIPDQTWDQGTFFESDSPTIMAQGSGQEGGAKAVLELTVWGTQLYWANDDGSVRRWWNSAGDYMEGVINMVNPFYSGPPQKSTLTDKGDSTEYFLKLNVPGGLNPAEWDVEVKIKPVQRSTMVDNILPGYSPWASTHDPSEYFETPQVTVKNGVIKVGFKTVGDFPGNSIGDGGATAPFEIVVRRKSDSLTVRQGGTINLFDTIGL